MLYERERTARKNIVKFFKYFRNISRTISWNISRQKFHEILHHYVTLNFSIVPAAVIRGNIHKTRQEHLRYDLCKFPEHARNSLSDIIEYLSIETCTTALNCTLICMGESTKLFWRSLLWLHPYQGRIQGLPKGADHYKKTRSDSHDVT